MRCLTHGNSHELRCDAVPEGREPQQPPPQQQFCKRALAAAAAAGFPICRCLNAVECGPFCWSGSQAVLSCAAVIWRSAAPQQEVPLLPVARILIRMMRIERSGIRRQPRHGADGAAALRCRVAAVPPPRPALVAAEAVAAAAEVMVIVGRHASKVLRHCSCTAPAVPQLSRFGIHGYIARTLLCRLLGSSGGDAQALRL